MNYNVVYSQSRGEWIYTHEFSDVLSIDESVDLLALDACFMGNLEFLYQICPGNGSFQADFVIASAPTEWSYGWDYESLFAKISKYKSDEITPMSLGELILENHIQNRSAEYGDQRIVFPKVYDCHK
jgi:clostripain